MTTVFIDTDYYLKSAHIFSQYIYKENKLITTIGELHDHEFNCKTPNKSIDEYVLDTVSKNPKTKVLLEYLPGQDPTLVGSHSIVNVFKRLKKNGKSDCIIPYDYRNYFLLSKGQNELYSNQIYKYNNSQIFKFFIEPFYTELKKGIFGLDINKYAKEIYTFLSFTYLEHLDKTFKNITSNLDKWDKETLLISLKHVWMIVTDYFALKEILMENNYHNEFIIIGGNKHIENIDNVLKTLPGIYTINLKRYNGRECIKLFQTYMLTN